MIVSIHQPNFIPYLGFFNKFKHSDTFVLYDTAQYSKNEYHNRNTIKTSNGAMWLTIPVSLELGDKIKDVQIANQSFRHKHLKTLELSYKKTDFFNSIFPDVIELYKGEETNLSDFNNKFLQYLFKIINPAIKIVKTSQLNIDPAIKSTEALIEIAKHVGATTYISGAGAKEYLDSTLFAANHIELQWQDFHHPQYKQLWGNFLPNMSVLDALFNIGPDGLRQIV